MKKSSNQEPAVIELEGDDAFLDMFCINKVRMSIVVIDQKLSELSDNDPNKQLLMQYRGLVDDANQKHNLPLLEARLDALYIGLKAASHTIPLAIAGEKFKGGRKPETGGPVRKAIALVMKDNPQFMPRHVWEQLLKNPPSGWKFREAPKPVGKYAEGPKPKEGKRPNMCYTRFCQICKEEKTKLID